jgi:putative ABC transport system ATP-binding protein
MVRALAATGIAVLNGDDPRVLWMAGVTRARVVTCGFGAGCDVRASDLRLDWPRGSRLRVDAFGESREFTVRLIGRHMMFPVLAAVAVARLEGIDFDAVVERLAALPPTWGRLEPVELPGGVTLLRDEFKSTLETMHAALDVFAQVPATRRIVLFGDVTEPPEDRRPVYGALGERVAAIADHLVVYGKGLADYSSGALGAGMSAASIHDGGNVPQRAAGVLREARPLDCRDVTVRFGAVTALAGVSLRVEPGEFVAVTGPSGAGKSTLLWALAGAVRPSAGAVILGSVPVVSRDQTAVLGVALVPQGNGLAAVLTALENVMLPLLAASQAPAAAHAAATAALASLGLGDSMNHLVEELSGGQQQRVAVARGLALGAPTLLTDEPTSELDHGNREVVLTLLRAHADAGNVVVMATHDPEAAAVADRVVRLDEGVLTVER